MNKVIGILALVLLMITSVAGGHDSYKPTSTPTPSTVNKTKSAALTRLNFEDSIRSLYNHVGLEKIGMNYDVFRYGMIGYYSLKNQGKVENADLVSFIDFTKNSTEKRFYTIDLKNYEVKFHSLVSHGKNTGENEAKFFSNRPNSNQSSLGFYLTGETYFGSKGYSMRLDGMDGSYNDKMRDRAVVMHDAAYVSDGWITKYGRLGRSQGCPALPKELSKKVIDAIKGKSVIFAYYNDAQYLSASSNLNLDNLFQKLDLIETATAAIN